MHRLEPEEWAHVVGKLSYEDTDALKLSGSVPLCTLQSAQQLWMCRAVDAAQLVTVVHISGDPVTRAVDSAMARVVVTSTPTPRGYILRRDGCSLDVPRRLYAHAFPRFCCDALRNPGRLWRIESFLAFAPEVASTLPIGWAGSVPEVPGIVTWIEARVATNVTLPGGFDVHARSEWPSAFQRHARFFVGMRVGRPRRQRGRRARRWTKVRP